MQIALLALEFHDGIAHELPGAVVGGLAASLYPHHLDPPGRKNLRWGQNVGGVTMATEGDDRRVLEEKKVIPHQIEGPGGSETVLEIPGHPIGNVPEPAGMEGPGARRGRPCPVIPWTAADDDHGFTIPAAPAADHRQRPLASGQLSRRTGSKNPSSTAARRVRARGPGWSS